MLGAVVARQVILFKLEQPLNALTPIEVTEFPIVIDVKLVQPANASLPIEVIM